MIDFPNHSRSYDQTRRAVRFWGHDSAIKASFFINEDALTRIQPDVRSDESGFLNAFDSNRDLSGKEPLSYFFLPDPNVGCQPAAVPF